MSNGNNNNNNNNNNSSSCSTTTSSQQKPLNIGVFGGSFNPIHLGHVLLAVTTSQTKNLDTVILVPVYKHAVKTDLLPYQDRVAMCSLAVSSFNNQGKTGTTTTTGGGIVEVSTAEQTTQKSNGHMLRHLKTQYHPQSKFYWICGDDIFTWIESSKGIETMKEVSGVIVQRRLHIADETKDQFYKCPKPTNLKIQSIQKLLPHLTFDFIHGELPHFSSTLVRRAPGHWRSFLPQSVARYLDERPGLLRQLNENLVMDAKREKEFCNKEKGMDHQIGGALLNNGNVNDSSFSSSSSSSAPTTPDPLDLAISTVMRGLEVVHALQWERGQTALWLSTTSTNHKDDIDDDLSRVRSVTDEALHDAATLPESQLNYQSSSSNNNNNNNNQNQNDIVLTTLSNSNLYETTSLAYELRHTQNTWLNRDRTIVNQQRSKLCAMEKTAEGWIKRYTLVGKFNSRIDVLVSCVVRSFREILDCSTSGVATATATADSTEKSNEGTTSTTKEENALISSNSASTFSADLLSKWCNGKEALGRLRAFVCAGGAHAPSIVRSSMDIRQKLTQIIATKERRMERVLTLASSASSRTTTTTTTSSSSRTTTTTTEDVMKMSISNTKITSSLEALHHMLERITAWEWSLMGCFASSTPLHLVHKLLLQSSSSSSTLSCGGSGSETTEFDVKLFFETTTSAIDLMLTVVKALAAFGCTRA